MKQDVWSIRFSEPEDGKYLGNWFQDDITRRWFPFYEPVEIEDTLRSIVKMFPQKASLTAIQGKEPVGMGIIYPHATKKLAHQTLFTLIVAPEHRGKKIGSYLLVQLMHLAKNYFGLSDLYLEVYQGNPAIRLYERFGFQKIAVRHHFLKEPSGEYLDQWVMTRKL